MNPDQDLRTMLRKRAEGVTATPVVPDSTIRRVRTRKTVMAGSAAGGRRCGRGNGRRRPQVGDSN